MAASFLAGGCNRSSSVDSDSEPVAPGPRRVVSLGRLEPARGIISISALPGERLRSYAEGVEEGVEVPAGAELGRVASYDLRETQLEAAAVKLELAQQQRQYEIAAAEAQVEQAAAGLAQTKAKREEVASQRYALQNLLEGAQIAEDDYSRLAQLQSSDAELVTEHQLRRKKNQADRATKEYEASSATFPVALAAAEQAVAAAEANVKLAKHQRELSKNVDQTLAIEMEKKVAQESLDQSVLRAPKAEHGSATYKILKVMMQPGEFVAQIPVLELGDLSRMVCIAEVYEADAKEIEPGQTAVIRSPAFSGEFADGTTGDDGGIAGKVKRVGTLVGSPGLTNRNPLAPSDRSVVEVVVEIDPKYVEATREAARWIGLQVTVEFGETPAAAKSASTRSEP